MIDLNRIARAILLVPAVLVVGIARLLRPLYLIRFGLLVSARIGHLAGNTEVYLCERAAGMHPKGMLGGIDLWAHVGPLCNAQLGRMIARQLHVDPTGFIRLCSVANRCFSGWEKHVAQPEQHDRDIHNLMEKQSRHILRWTNLEQEAGKEGLRRMGIPEGAKLVCLIVRDGAYLPHPHFWYHRHRDTKIGSYGKAAIALAERGYYVIRMGAAVVEKFHAKHERIIDYATNGMRNDFMDIYLCAHCEFCVTSGAGLDSICAIARRPMCYVNFVPLELMGTFNRGLLIWQHHWRRGKRLSPAEIFELGAGQFERSDQFRTKGILLRYNTPDEIEAVCLEMHYDKPLDDNDGVHRRFWKQFPIGTISVYNGKPLHGEIRLRIGRDFLRSYDASAILQKVRDLESTPSNHVRR